MEDIKNTATTTTNAADEIEDNAAVNPADVDEADEELDADKAEAMEFAREAISEFSDAELEAALGALTLGLTIKALAFNQTAGSPAEFLHLTMWVATSMSAKGIEKAAQMIGDELKARRN